MACTWCGTEEIRDGAKNCYWVKPDGKTAVEILEVPAVDCPNCGQYVSETMAQQIEEALYWNDVSALGLRFRYDALMNAPRLRKPW